MDKAQKEVVCDIKPGYHKQAGKESGNCRCPDARWTEAHLLLSTSGIYPGFMLGAVFLNQLMEVGQKSLLGRESTLLHLLYGLGDACINLCSTDLQMQD